MKHKIIYMFVARTMKITFKVRENVHLRKYKMHFILTVFFWALAQDTMESV
jgi:hypothetical protein